jgi:hypothetical protein
MYPATANQSRTSEEGVIIEILPKCKRVSKYIAAAHRVMIPNRAIAIRPPNCKINAHQDMYLTQFLSENFGFAKVLTQKLGFILACAISVSDLS